MRPEEEAHKHTPRHKSADEFVAVCFADSTINEVFAALVRAQGVRARVVADLDHLHNETHVITELQYFPTLPSRYFKHTLVVENCATPQSLPVLTLTRPLTEAKITRALEEFLR